MAGNLSRTRFIERLAHAGLLGAALTCAGAGGALANAAPDARAPESLQSPQGIERKAPPALVLPDREGFVFGLLGSLEVRTPAHRFHAQWRDLLKRVDAERDGYAACMSGADCVPQVMAWRALIAELDGLPRHEQMKRVNAAVNRLVDYTDDATAFRVRDHWATPLEALTHGGDCEDYAILKFVTLLELGFEADQLRVTIVRNKRNRARGTGTMHAVLAVRLDDRTYILDNLNSYAVEQHYVLKYVPLYSASLDAQWVHVVTPQIRARFVAHVMREQKQAEKRPANRVAAAGEPPLRRYEKS